MAVLYIIASIVLLIPDSIHAQSADFDNSGKVGFVDFLQFAQSFGSSDPLFDLNENGTVDFTDFLAFTQAFLVDNPPAPPSISLSSTTFEFGEVEPKMSDTQILTVSNSGLAELFVTSITSSDGQFETSLDSFVVRGGGRREVEIIFTPDGDGTHSAELSIVSNDADQGTVIVALTGNGVTPLRSSIRVVTPLGGTHTMNLVPEGEFIMGEALTEDSPVILIEFRAPLHPVFLAAYYIDRHEVTNELFISYLNTIGTNFDPTTGNRDLLIDIVAGAITFTDKFELKSAEQAQWPVTYVSWAAASAYCA